MGDITSGCDIRVAVPNMGAKSVLIKVAVTSQHSDTIVLTLSKYGISTFLGCVTFLHTTAESVITLETTNASTTAVSSGVLTVTIASGATDSKERTILIWGV